MFRYLYFMNYVANNNKIINIVILRTIRCNDKKKIWDGVSFRQLWYIPAISAILLHNFLTI